MGLAFFVIANIFLMTIVTESLHFLFVLNFALFLEIETTAAD